MARRVRKSEAGHAGPVPAMLLAAAGAVVLGIGAANDTGWLAIVGGIVLGAGIVGSFLLNHMLVEYDIYARLDKLEKK